MEMPAPATGASRSSSDRGAIIEAGRKVGLDKLAGTLADFSPDNISLDQCLEVIRFQGALKAESERHSSGLYLDPALSVRGGPLFATPDADASPGPGRPAADYGWADVVAAVTKKH